MYRNKFFSVIFIVLLAITISFRSYSAEAKQINFPTIEANKSGLLVQNYASRQSPTIVFIFTSWCPVCRQNFPVLVDLAKKYKQQGLNVLALSMDSKPSDLERYVSSYNTIPFTPYFVKQSSPGDFGTALSRIGIRYRNAIPYTIIYDTKGKLVGQGSIAIASLDNVVASLVDKNSAYNKSQR